MMWRFDRFGDAAALLDEHGQSLTYAQLAREGEALCGAIGGRCLCFNLCGNTLGSAVGYAGMVEGGVTPALLAASIDRELFQALYEAYHPAYLWAPEGFEWEACESVYERFGYRLLRTPFGTETKLHDDLALLLTTSGSTGSPKFVRQSYANIRANTESIVEYLALTAQEKPITTLPMNYTYGLSIVNSHVLVGAPVLLTRKGLLERGFWDFAAKEGATSLAGVPYTYEMYRRIGLQEMDLPALKTVTQAGGKLTLALHQSFASWAEKTGRRFFVMYGQTEAAPRMGYLPAERAVEKCGSMGIPIPGGTFQLLDVQDQVIQESDTVGELLYRGPNVAMGYAQQADDLALGDEWGGVLHTGDMAKQDTDGFYYIVGRKKRFLKLYGNRVNLDELERMLAEPFPGVGFACTGHDDDLRIFSDLKDETQIRQAEDYLAQRTNLPHKLFHIIPIDAIPKNEAGKTLYSRLPD